MTEKKTKKFTAFSSDEKYDREIRWKKTKNGFHDHGPILAWCLHKTS